MKNRDKIRDENANRDPITGAPGAHPIGTGVGALAGGAATGATVGTIAGPVGILIGTAVGAIAGGLAGKGVSEAIDPTREDTYWRDNDGNRPRVELDSSFDDYGRAYTFGVEAASRHPGRTFDEIEPEMLRQWNDANAESTLRWESARNAVRDAWKSVNGPA